LGFDASKLHSWKILQNGATISQSPLMRWRSIRLSTIPYPNGPRARPGRAGKTRKAYRPRSKLWRRRSQSHSKESRGRHVSHESRSPEVLHISI
jgi:hypothetical protein